MTKSLGDSQRAGGDFGPQLASRCTDRTRGLAVGHGPWSAQTPMGLMGA